MPYDFTKGKIYKLVSDINDSFYVGSTTTALSKRRFQHSNRPMPGVKLLFDEIGWKELKIVLIETWPCESSEQLKQRERHWYDLLKPDLNRRRPHATAEEKKDLSREYRSDPVNKVKVKVRMAEYRAKPVNKERISKYDAEYRSDPVNKEKASKYRSDPLNKVKAANYQKSPRGKAKHAARRSVKVLCCCGCEINSSSKYTHRQSKKHHLLYSQVLADFIFS